MSAPDSIYVQNAGHQWNYEDEGYVKRFELRSGDIWVLDGSADKERSEIALSNKLQFDKSYDISFSTLIEAGDKNSADWMTLVQIQSTFDAGEAGHSPGFALEMVGDKMRIVTRDSSALMSTQSNTTYRNQYTDSTDIVRDHWYDFDIKIKIDPAGGGSMEVWRDGLELCSYQGAIGFNDTVGPYLKAGIYRESSSETFAVDFKNISVNLFNNQNNLSADRQPALSNQDSQTSSAPLPSVQTSTSASSDHISLDAPTNRVEIGYHNVQLGAEIIGESHSSLPFPAASSSFNIAAVVPSDLTAINSNLSNSTVSLNAQSLGLRETYRFFNTHTGDHFYTTSAVEAGQIKAGIPFYTYEGVAWATPDKGAGTQDVFRFFDTKTGTHFFTTDVGERDGIIESGGTYQYEGVAFQAYANPAAAGTGGITLERFFDTKTGQHHMAGNAAEAYAINHGAAGPGWVDEGPTFTVHSADSWMFA